MTPISTATNTAGTPITVGSEPGEPAIVPDQGPPAAFTETASAASVSFNASASTDPDGSVASHSWSFGDGTHATTSAPTITHAYPPGHSSTATLTVTDNEGCSTTVIFTGHTVSCNGSRAAQTAHVVSTPTVTQPPRCALTVKSNTVRLARPKPTHGRTSTASVGTLSVSVTCNEAVTVKLAGVLTELLGHKPKHGKRHTKTFTLGPLHGSLRAGIGRTLALQLPHGALGGLHSKTDESVTLTLIATNGNGTGHARATIASLKGAP